MNRQFGSLILFAECYACEKLLLRDDSDVVSMNVAVSAKNPSMARRRWQRWGIGCLRLGVILAAMLCLWCKPVSESIDLEAYLALGKEVYPTAQKLGETSDGWHALLTADGDLLGWVTTTNPQARQVQGYAGPSELAIVADAQHRVKRVQFWRSADTAGHVEKVRRDQRFWTQWNGRAEASLGLYENPQLVSGASLTSEAMARGLAARFGATGMEQLFARELSIDEVKPWFATASNLIQKEGCYEVRDGEKLLGMVLRSSRMAVAVRGFNGSSDVLVALDADDAKVLGVAVRESRENEPYLTDVKDELQYAHGFAEASIEQIIGTADHTDLLLVSGASTTARSVFGTVQEMLRRHTREQQSTAFPWRISLGMVWLSAGVWLGFRGGKKSRAVFACCSVVAGLWLGWMVGQDQLIGWGQHGWKTLPALPLLVMTAIALIIPAFTGKNVYCSRICPHGAAQTLAGMAWKKRWALPARVHRIFSAVPWLSLLAIWALALAGSRLPFAHAEPFEVWSTGFVALLPAVVFTMSIVVSFFLPQGYCHYGCPTGALLKFLTHAPGRWTRRDSIAASLVAVAWLVTLF